MNYVVTVLEDVVGISRTYLSINVAIWLYMDSYDQAPLKSTKMQDQ
jgi:hypothetical protein